MKCEWYKGCLLCPRNTPTAVPGVRGTKVLGAATVFQNPSVWGPFQALGTVQKSQQITLNLWDVTEYKCPVSLTFCGWFWHVPHPASRRVSRGTESHFHTTAEPLHQQALVLQLASLGLYPTTDVRPNHPVWKTVDIFPIWLAMPKLEITQFLFISFLFLFLGSFLHLILFYSYITIWFSKSNL